MIPKYPFQVHVTYRISDSQQNRQTKSFETAPAAMAYLLTMKNKQNTKRVELSFTLFDMKAEQDQNNKG